MKKTSTAVKKLLSLKSTMELNKNVLTTDIKLASNQKDPAQKAKAQGLERYSPDKKFAY